MMRKHNRKKNTSQPQEKEPVRLKETLTLTSALIQQETHIELTGNHEAMVDGCKGIVEYNETTIRLNIKEGQLKIVGRNLQIACMTEDSMIIRGYIINLEYCN